MRSVSTSRSELLLYGSVTDGGAEGVARSLDLLRAIERTNDYTTGLCGYLDGSLRKATEFVEHIAHGRVDGDLPEGDVLPIFENLQGHLQSVYRSLKRRRDSAASDPSLKDEDCVVDGYNKAVRLVDSLYSKIEELRWAVMEFNADKEASKATHPLSTEQEIDQFFADL